MMGEFRALQVGGPRLSWVWEQLLSICQRNGDILENTFNLCRSQGFPADAPNIAHAKRHGRTLGLIDGLEVSSQALHIIYKCFI